MRCKGRALKWQTTGWGTREESVFEVGTGGARRPKTATEASVSSRDQLRNLFVCAFLSV